MESIRKLSFLVFLLCLLISLRNENAKIKKGSSQPKNTQEMELSGSLRYDYYNESCPQAEQIIKSTLQQLYQLRPDTAPELLKLFFHDCFIGGCDASVLLDTCDGIESEKDTSPNESLKGFDQIDIIKSELEETCPGVVSCADIVVLAARESVLQAGGPFYPLFTGRRDSTVSFYEEATHELPSTQDDIVKITKAFGSRGFDERETVSLLGAHSTGMIHCKFIINRLYNFDGTNRPDPSIDPEFLELLRSKCNSSHASFCPSPFPAVTPSPSSSFCGLSSALLREPGMKMDYKGSGSNFGTLYYRSLLQGRGILYADQQLTAGEETEIWVQAYASDASLFKKDFIMAMTKLSNHRVLTAPSGQVRSDCRRVV